MLQSGFAKALLSVRYLTETICLCIPRRKKLALSTKDALKSMPLHGVYIRLSIYIIKTNCQLQ